MFYSDIPTVGPYIQKPFRIALEKQKEKLHRKPGQGGSTTSVSKIEKFTLKFISCCCCCFVVVVVVVDTFQLALDCPEVMETFLGKIMFGYRIFKVQMSRNDVFHNEVNSLMK